MNLRDIETNIFQLRDLERKKIDKHYNKIKKYNNMIQKLEDQIKNCKKLINQENNQVDKIKSIARKRLCKKCNHDYSEPYSKSTHYDACGNDWCGYSDYHFHFECLKCGWDRDEPH